MRVLLTAAVFALATSPALADQCLNMKFATNTHFVSDRVMTVETKNHELYTVTFTNACDAQKYPLTHFVYEQWTQLCVSEGSVFPTNDKGPCFVKSVTQQSNP